MAKKGYKISKEIKDEILAKIKNESLSVADVAKQYGISNRTIYGWLGSKAGSTISVVENEKMMAIEAPIIPAIENPRPLKSSDASVTSK